jgi:tyrosinase
MHKIALKIISPYQLQFSETIKMSDHEKILLLFQRPFEPSFFPKDDGKTVMILPDDYLPERYQDNNKSIVQRFDDGAQKRITVNPITIPDLSFAADIPRNGPFSISLDHHKKVATRLVKMFMEQKDIDSLLSIGVYCRDRTNPYVFIYAWSIALSHREDCKEIPIPSIIQTFPDQFISPSLRSNLFEEGRIPEAQRVCEN